MLSHDLKSTAAAMRMSAAAPSCDLRSSIRSYADAAEVAARRAADLEEIIARQAEQLPEVIRLKAVARRVWHFLTTSFVEAAR
jgi:hypothetical protein